MTSTERAEIQPTEHVDVLIVGAGISGIGAAYHLAERFPEKSFVVLDALESHGGTWWTHRYPGVRSDSDLFTFGYRFKPWRGASIASAEEILAYLDEVIDESDLDAASATGTGSRPRTGRPTDRRWTVEVTREDTGEELRFTTGFLWMCQGYYDHGQAYRPSGRGMDRFSGLVVHPQQWPADLDLAGKRVVVIGSGATAATLIPAIAETAAHVTMLQRSPTFFFARPKTHELADDAARRWTSPRSGRTRSCAAPTSPRAPRSPGCPSSRPTSCARSSSSRCGRCCPRGSTSTSTSTPPTGPWQQRLAVVPDGDLFTALREGNASVVTDTIETFTETGIRLASGEELEADVVVTATGFDLSVFGDVAFTVDGEPVDFAEQRHLPRR